MPERENETDDATAAAAYRALLYAVNNDGTDSDDPPGETMLQIDYDRQTRRYNVGIECGETGCHAESPKLQLALRALSFCDEGEGVLVDVDGQARCRECTGVGCGECDQTGRDVCAPHSWPKEGLPVHVEDLICTCTVCSWHRHGAKRTQDERAPVMLPRKSSES